MSDALESVDSAMNLRMVPAVEGEAMIGGEARYRLSLSCRRTVVFRYTCNFRSSSLSTG